MTMNVDDFTSLAAWGNGGGVSISPASWAYHVGNAFGTGHISRAIGSTGSVYCEAKVYNDQNSGNWCMMKMNSQGSNLYNTTAGDGFGLYVSQTSLLNVLCGGTLTHTGWSGQFTPQVPPASIATAFIMGIHKISSTVFDIYVNRVKVGRTTTTQAVTGPNYDIGGFNGSGTHIDYFISSDVLLTTYDPSNAPAKVSY